jgi:hypothetical protein
MPVAPIATPTVRSRTETTATPTTTAREGTRTDRASLPGEPGPISGSSHAARPPGGRLTRRGARGQQTDSAGGESGHKTLTVETTDLSRMQAEVHAQQNIASTLSQIPRGISELATKVGDWMLQLLQVLGTRF